MIRSREISQLGLEEIIGEFKMAELQKLKGFNVANHFEKRQLLIAINCVAALSIFFFGYDQGMMGGVNNAK